MIEMDWPVDTTPCPRFPVYTRLNALDVLPAPITPLAASMCWKPGVMPGWAAGNVEDRSFDPEELRHPSAVCGFFYGHFYINQSTTRVLGARKGLAWQDVDAAFFNSPGAPPHEPHPDDDNPALRALALGRAAWALSTSSFAELEEDRAIAERARMERPNLNALSDRGLIARARTMTPLELLMWRGEVIAGTNAAVGPAVAASLLPPDKAHLLIACIGQAGEVDSAQPSYALWSLSRMVRQDADLMTRFDRGVDSVAADLTTACGAFWTAFRRFLAEFGYRGPCEWDLGAHSWESQPALALALIERLRHQSDDKSPAARQMAHVTATEAALREAVASLEPAKEATFRGAVGSARRFAAWRERGKTNCVKIINEARMPLMELGRRLAARGAIAQASHVFMALDEELDALAVSTGEMRDRLSEREARWQFLGELQVPTFLDGNKPLPGIHTLPRKQDVQVRHAPRGTILRGASGSQGTAEGTARVISAIDAIDDFQPGEILVAPQTDPSWTPLFMAASAVVVNTGSMASHAMIIARELGIPCIAGLPDATRLIETGARVRVDGGRGTVEIL